jgi:hypothetical protein
MSRIVTVLLIHHLLEETLSCKLHSSTRLWRDGLAGRAASLSDQFALGKAA